jgi:hypothetical protein
MARLYDLGDDHFRDFMDRLNEGLAQPLVRIVHWFQDKTDEELFEALAPAMGLTGLETDISVIAELRRLGDEDPASYL